MTAWRIQATDLQDGRALIVIRRNLKVHTSKVVDGDDAGRTCNDYMRMIRTGTMPAPADDASEIRAHVKGLDHAFLVANTDQSAFSCCKAECCRDEFREFIDWRRFA